MPELPEVETTVRQLEREILEREIIDVWSDNPKMLKKVVSEKVININLKEFKKDIAISKIKRIRRKGKNILIELDNNKVLLIHQKLTGHLLVGKWQMINGKWQSVIKGPLTEKVNKYIHLIFWLSGEEMIVLSDLRKFAKVILGKKYALLNLPEIKNLGLDPLGKDFTTEKFKKILQKTKRKIKQALMDQKIIAGIGNIYSDEILWQVKISPFKRTQELTGKEFERIYLAIKKILKKAIELQGESISDWRNIKGKKGEYDRVRKVYRREGIPCSRCGTKIQRKKIGGRSTHFCPTCQPYIDY